ncbi:uncharacterized protein LOC111702753 [Eurytemora carolleeae]|uniref:uncharacterized protein LOC111702753 n=1 Tax=Eurytemora carolleeae TaxID=1294199 RepID=UPI000C790387|nr:uncharacterized protein LOC111702753 [Eurytemora carolleeae]|eukprot:XP_023330303.1 uncharacterized protein LOC111702753 [Eurytemora affinis]
MRILFVVLVLSLVLFCLVEAAKQDKKRKHAKIDVGRRRKQAKTTKKQGIRRRTLQKTVKSGNAKSVARANEVGNGCDYVVLSELPTRAKGCVNGAKFVIRPGSNSRRQYVIMNGKPLLLWVTRGTKFTDCTAFTDRTASISCKEVTGLAAIDLGVTGAPGTNTTAAPSSGNKTLP